VTERVDVAVVGAGQAVDQRAQVGIEVSRPAGHAGLGEVKAGGEAVQRKGHSAVLYGVGEDAEIVAQHIVDKRK